MGRICHFHCYLISFLLAIYVSSSILFPKSGQFSVMRVGLLQRMPEIMNTTIGHSDASFSIGLDDLNRRNRSTSEDLADTSDSGALGEEEHHLISISEMQTALATAQRITTLSHDEIKKEGWNVVHESDAFCLYKRRVQRKDNQPGPVEYLMTGTFDDISPRAFLHSQVSRSYRRQWDSTMREMSDGTIDVLKIIDEPEKTKSDDVLYYRTKWPWPLKDRDYTLARRCVTFNESSNIVFVSKSTEAAEHPPEDGVIRVDNYWCHSVFMSTRTRKLRKAAPSTLNTATPESVDTSTEDGVPGSSRPYTSTDQHDLHGGPLHSDESNEFDIPPSQPDLSVDGSSSNNALDNTNQVTSKDNQKNSVYHRIFHNNNNNNNEKHRKTQLYKQALPILTRKSFTDGIRFHYGGGASATSSSTQPVETATASYGMLSNFITRISPFSTKESDVVATVSDDESTTIHTKSSGSASKDTFSKTRPTRSSSFSSLLPFSSFYTSNSNSAFDDDFYHYKLQARYNDKHHKKDYHSYFMRRKWQQQQQQQLDSYKKKQMDLDHDVKSSQAVINVELPKPPTPTATTASSAGPTTNANKLYNTEREMNSIKQFHEHVNQHLINTVQRTGLPHLISTLTHKITAIFHKPMLTTTAISSVNPHLNNYNREESYRMLCNKLKAHTNSHDKESRRRLARLVRMLDNEIGLSDRNYAANVDTSTSSDNPSANDDYDLDLDEEDDVPLVSKPGMRFVTIFCDDQRVPLPPKVMDFLSKQAEKVVPGSIESLHEVARNVDFELDDTGK